MNTSIILRISVFILALLQPFSGYLSTFNNSSITENIGNPTITPSGYAFAIWGIICLGSVLYAVYQLLPNRRNKELYDAIAPYVIVLFSGFTLWLYAANQEWIWGTVLIFIGMGLALTKIFPKIVDAFYAKKLSTTEQIVTHWTFGLYAGWTTVAIFANIAAGIKKSGISDMGITGMLWQAIILLIVTSVCYRAIEKTKGSTPYALTIFWAFVAIIIGTIERIDVAGILPWVAGVATLVLLWRFVTLKFKWETGRQDSGYSKMLIATSMFPIPWDFYILKYPIHSGIAEHVDPVTDRAHYRLNIIVKKAKKGGEFKCEKCIINTQRIKLFRPDLYKHSLTQIEEGSRYVISIGWAPKI